jgi:hypothetical protein
MSSKSLPVLILAAVLAVPAGAEPRIEATIDVGKTRAPISPYIYGQFMEHIGDLVNRSVWAEMVDDRKFYYAINSETPAPPAPTQGPPRGDGRTAGGRSVRGDGSRSPLCRRTQSANQVSRRGTAWNSADGARAAQIRGLLGVLGVGG